MSQFFHYIRCFFSHLSSRRAETILEATIALFILGTGITVMTVMSNRVLNLTAESKLHLQAKHFAQGGIDLVRTVRDTNTLRFANPACWNTLASGDVCDPVNDEKMATGTDPELYSIFFDHTAFTPALTPSEAGDFSTSAILSRVATGTSLHRLYTGANDTLPIIIGQSISAENTNFYRQISITSVSPNLDANPATNAESMLVTSTVKWPYRTQVREYSISYLMNNLSE